MYVCMYKHIFEIFMIAHSALSNISLFILDLMMSSLTNLPFFVPLV